MSEEKVLNEEVVEEVVEQVNDQVLAMPDPNAPIVTVRRLLEAGVHFGHQTRKWNPKMKPYIYTSRNGMYVIDLTKSVSKVCEAYLALKKIVEEGGKVIFVGTKKQAQEIVKEEALRSGSFYATNRWIGGTLTNFKTVRRSIENLKRIEAMEEDGTFQVLPKKEVAEYLKLKEKLEKNYGGIREMLKTPNALFVVDPKEEENAVREARKLRIPVFAIVNTSSDPDLVDYVIPGNDVGAKAIRFIVSLMADAVVEAKGGIPTVAYVSDGAATEATMDDVMANVERVNEAIQLRKQQEAAARREAAMRAQQKRFGNKKPFTKGPKKAEDAPKAEEAPKAEVKEEVKTEEAPKAKKTIKKVETPKVEEPKAEVKEEVKTEEAPKDKKTTKKVEEKVEVKEEVKTEEAPKAKKTTKKAEVKEEVKEEAPKAKKTTKKAEKTAE